MSLYQGSPTVVLGYFAFIAAVILGYYTAANVISVAFLLYRHYGPPKLAPAPPKTRPFGIAIGLAVFIGLIVVYIPLNLPPRVAQILVYLLYVAIVLGVALFIAIDVYQFRRNSVCLVFPPESALRDIALRFVEAEDDETIELWLPIGTMPDGFMLEDDDNDESQVT